MVCCWFCWDKISKSHFRRIQLNTCSPMTQLLFVCCMFIHHYFQQSFLLNWESKILHHMTPNLYLSCFKLLMKEWWLTMCLQGETGRGVMFWWFVCIPLEVRESHCCITVMWWAPCTATSAGSFCDGHSSFVNQKSLTSKCCSRETKIDVWLVHVHISAQDSNQLAVTAAPQFNPSVLRLYQTH